jgi:hypothetical protein
LARQRVPDQPVLECLRLAALLFDPTMKTR